MSQYFTTGNGVFEDGFAILIRFPKSQSNWVYGVFLGALAWMTDVNAWMTSGETDREEAALIYKNIFEGIQPMLFIIGYVGTFAAPIPDDMGWLQCDGDEYAQTDYPDLYDAIGDTYNTGGETSGYFRVPDLRGRVVATVNTGLTRLPSWADDAGGAGGESEHTLDVSEMPFHNHTTGNSTTIVAVVPGEGPVLAPNPIPAVTGDTGGDGAHNNVQPTIVMYSYILAKI